MHTAIILHISGAPSLKWNPDWQNNVLLCGSWIDVKDCA